MTATRTITLTFELAARTGGDLPASDDVRRLLGHGLPPIWWSRDAGYWITAIWVPPQPADLIGRLSALTEELIRDAANQERAKLGLPPA